MKLLWSLIIIITLLISVGSGYEIYQWHVQQGVLEITFLDVGQGDAILIKTPKNNYGLIDAGAGNALQEVLPHYLPASQQKLTFIVGTHADADHIGGFASLFDTYRVDFSFLHKVDKETRIFEDLVTAIGTHQTTNYHIFDVHDFVIDGVFFNTLWPRAGTIPYHEENVNDTSISFLITYNDITILLAGDLSNEYEALILDDISTPVSVLKASHHGSNTSTNASFVQTIQPEISIISAGKDNRYGHPHPEVLNNLESINSQILRTDLHGSITLQINETLTIRCSKECK